MAITQKKDNYNNKTKSKPFIENLNSICKNNFASFLKSLKKLNRVFKISSKQLLIYKIAILLFIILPLVFGGLTTFIIEIILILFLVIYFLLKKLNSYLNKVERRSKKNIIHWKKLIKSDKNAFLTNKIIRFCRLQYNKFKLGTARSFKKLTKKINNFIETVSNLTYKTGKILNRIAETPANIYSNNFLKNLRQSNKLNRQIIRQKSQQTAKTKKFQNQKEKSEKLQKKELNREGSKKERALSTKEKLIKEPKQVIHSKENLDFKKIKNLQAINNKEIFGKKEQIKPLVNNQKIEPKIKNNTNQTENKPILKEQTNNTKQDNTKNIQSQKSEPAIAIKTPKVEKNQPNISQEQSETKQVQASEETKQEPKEEKIEERPKKVEIKQEQKEGTKVEEKVEPKPEQQKEKEESQEQTKAEEKPEKVEEIKVKEKVEETQEQVKKETKVDKIIEKMLELATTQKSGKYDYTKAKGNQDLQNQILKLNPQERKELLQKSKKIYEKSNQIISRGYF